MCDCAELCGAYFKWKMACYPLYAGTQGIHHCDPLMPRRGLQAFKDDIDTVKDFIANSKKQLAVVSVSGKDQRYFKLLIWELETFLENVHLNGHLLPEVNFFEGIHMKMPTWCKTPNFFKLDTVEDYQNVLTKYRAVEPYIEGTLELLREGMRTGMMYARESLWRCESQFERLQVENVEDSDFYHVFKNIPEDKFAQDNVEKLRAEAKAVIKDVVLPAFKKLGDFIMTDYIAKARPEPGVHCLPNGTAFYQGCLEFHTSIQGITPKEVHQLGLDLLDDLKRGVKDIQIKLKQPDLSISEFFQYVQKLPEQTFKSSDELLSYIKHLVDDIINPKLEQVVEKRWRTETLYALRVEALPPGDNAMAYYSRATIDNSRKAAFWINLDKVDNFKKFELLSLALHEGNPGHHFHLTVFNSGYGYPDFFRVPTYDDISASPSRVPFNTAHIEGWGLYSEFLGHELGLYKDDDFALLGYYSWNLLRTARLVIDTGLHAFGWSRERAMNYFVDNTGLSRRNAEVEIDRYITWPGQATSYKVGEMKIRQFRESEEKRMGKCFDLGKFHTDVLSRMGPLDRLDSGGVACC